MGDGSWALALPILPCYLTCNPLNLLVLNLKKLNEILLVRFHKFVVVLLYYSQKIPYPAHIKLFLLKDGKLCVGSVQCSIDME
jgi:hypothetical protein